MKTLVIKSLLTSLCQREVIYPSLEKRGVGRFFNNNALLMNSLVRKFTSWIVILLLFTGCATGISSKAPQAGLEQIEGAFLQAKWDEVITSGEKRLQGEPDNAILHFVLSMAYYMKGDYGL